MATFVKDYRQAATFRPGKFNPIALAQNDRLKAVLACFEAGQFIPVHSPGVDVTFVILEGAGTIMAGAEKQTVAPGSFAFIPAGQARG